MIVDSIERRALLTGFVTTAVTFGIAQRLGLSGRIWDTSRLFAAKWTMTGDGREYGIEAPIYLGEDPIAAARRVFFDVREADPDFWSSRGDPSRFVAIVGTGPDAGLPYRRYRFGPLDWQIYREAIA